MRMPSLKGAIAETAIAAEATRLGIRVYRPIADGGRCDLIFELGSRVLRVQCKWAVRQGDVVIVTTGTSRRGPNGSYIRSTYTAEEVDAIAAYCEETQRCYLLPISLVGGLQALSLRLAPPRNNQRAGLNWGPDYELGAIAQLEERRHGMAEAVGSSPTSSTRRCAESLVIGAHEFRNRFGWYMERARAGESILVTRHGSPALRLSPAFEQGTLAA